LFIILEEPSRSEFEAGRKAPQSKDMFDKFGIV
jgi:hypothetical protein